MNAPLIEQRRREIVEQYGEWEGENFQLFGDVYTRGKDANVYNYRLQRLVRMIEDFHGSFSDLRVLDIGSFEGAHSIEFALRGSQVVGIEGRDTNLAKARFAQEVLRLNDLEFIKDDIRNISKEKYGEYDLTLCSGVLYHLNEPDVFTFLESVGSVTKRYAIIDTHISISPVEKVSFKEKDYYGWSYVEFAQNPSAEQEEEAVLSSMGNLRSFWLTRASLYNFLSGIGFTSIYECHVPNATLPKDRVTLLAIKGQVQGLRCSPVIKDYPTPPYNEEQPEINSQQKSYFELKSHAHIPLWRRLVSRFHNSLQKLQK